MREEIKDLIERANLYLNSANLLLENKDFDSSVSRSYYAMFFTTEALLLTKELKFSSHREVISAFGQHFVKTGVFSPEMRKYLQESFEKRQLGDYSFRSVIEENTAKEVLEKAKDFVSKIVKYLKEQNLYEDSSVR